MSPALHTSVTRPVTAFVEGAAIDSILGVPDHAKGLVIFAHGTSRGRSNRKTRQLAEILNDTGFATLVCDLLTEEEGLIDDLTGEFRFDSALLSKRLVAMTGWCARNAATRGLRAAYFGAGTGAAAALMAAAANKDLVRAIVIRGGRLDLAWNCLPNVRAPTLMIVGEYDSPMRASYSVSIDRLGCTQKRLVVMPRRAPFSRAWRVRGPRPACRAVVQRSARLGY